MKRPRGPARFEALLRYHQTLLADRHRNHAFARALRAVVRPGSAVVDVGAGSGIWAVLAARLGAKRVVAIEKQPLLVPVIERLARENGVSDRVSVRRGDSRRLDLPRAFDVVVSETVGTEGFDEHIVPVLADARRRFLRPSGVIVPRAVSLFASPAVAPGPVGVRPRLVADQGLRELLVHVPNAVPAPDIRVVGSPASLLRVELGRARETPPLDGLRASFRLREASRVNCIALWSELELTRAVRLSTREASAWGVTYFPLEPLGRGPCALDLELALEPRHRWRVVVRRKSTPAELRDYDPLLAYGALTSGKMPR